MLITKTKMKLPGFSLGLILAVVMVLVLLTSRSIRVVWLPNRLSPDATASDQIGETTNNNNNNQAQAIISPSKGPGFPPVLAYWILGTCGDGKRMVRLLKAIYHPRNQYLLELDAESCDEEERADLATLVGSERVFEAFGNVNVVGKSLGGVNKMGASALAAMLHAAALMLRLSPHWDWFINLSADEYPLVTPDDLLHAMSSLPRDLNFIHYTNSTDLNQIVVDNSLHMKKGSYLYYAVEKRDTPEAFQIFGGSPRLILTRELLEYCVQGWDNLPRKLLMYFTNTPYPLHSYFHTVLCNSPEFHNTTIFDSDLRYNINYKDVDDAAHIGRGLQGSRFSDMLASGAVFARKFNRDEDDDQLLILDKVDEDVLKRRRDGVVPGQWCNDGGEEMGDLCSSWGNNVNIDVVKAGQYGTELRILLSSQLGRNATSYCHQSLFN